MATQKKELKKKLEQYQSTIVKTRAQKKAAEAEAKAAETELRAGNSASENNELKRKRAQLNTAAIDLTSGCEEF